MAIGTYDFAKENNSKAPIMMCKTFYKKGIINATAESYQFDARHVQGKAIFFLKSLSHYYFFCVSFLCNEQKCDEFFFLLDCFKIHPIEKCAGSNCTEVYDIEEFLEERNKTINFDRYIIYSSTT